MNLEILKIFLGKIKSALLHSKGYSVSLPCVCLTSAPAFPSFPGLSLGRVLQYPQRESPKASSRQKRAISHHCVR